MAAILALMAELSAALDTPPQLRIAYEPSGKCTAIWNGTPVDDDEVLKRANAWRRTSKAGRLAVDGTTNAPYRCIGAILYTVQSAGLDLYFSPLPSVVK